MWMSLAPFLHRVEYDVVDQAYDGILAAGILVDVADVFDDLFDQRHIGRFGIFYDVVYHEDLGIRQRGYHPPDILRPADVYEGHSQQILQCRARLKNKTIQLRCQFNLCIT